jgi:hypothetical protein
MISTILSLGGIVGLLVGAGFMGGFISPLQASKHRNPNKAAMEPL